MTILLNLNQFRAPPTSEIAAWIKKYRKRTVGSWIIRRELNPSDLYVYLFAKFGPPNGIQNFLRNDDSDNLIHWDWTLKHKQGLLIFLGMNLRTEVVLIGQWKFAELSKDQLIRFIKKDYEKYGKAMSQIRHKVLEDWEMFINPYHQLRSSIDDMREQLDQLELTPDDDSFEDPRLPSDYKKLEALLNTLRVKYTRAYGLIISLRTLAPVLAESFVNLLMFILLKPELSENIQLREAAFRAHIDIRVQSLHINCQGFRQKVNWSSPECRAYSKVTNARNDLLHGNIVVSKLKTREIYFKGKVPVFKEYVGLWDQLITTSLQACGYPQLETTLNDVDSFIEYVLTCLDPEIRSQVEYMIDRRELGRNIRTGRLGVLLPDYIVDIQGERVK